LALQAIRPSMKTWRVTLGFCLYLNLGAGMEIVFLGLPGWFAAAFSFVVLSTVIQRRRVLA
jgi:hypothetical protein